MTEQVGYAVADDLVITAQTEEKLQRRVCGVAGSTGKWRT